MDLFRRDTQFMVRRRQTGTIFPGLRRLTRRLTRANSQVLGKSSNFALPHSNYRTLAWSKSPDDRRFTRIPSLDSGDSYYPRVRTHALRTSLAPEDISQLLQQYRTKDVRMIHYRLNPLYKISKEVQTLKEKLEHITGYSCVMLNDRAYMNTIQSKLLEEDENCPDSISMIEVKRTESLRRTLSPIPDRSRPHTVIGMDESIYNTFPHLHTEAVTSPLFASPRPELHGFSTSVSDRLMSEESEGKRKWKAGNLVKKIVPHFKRSDESSLLNSARLSQTINGMDDLYELAAKLLHRKRPKRKRLHRVRAR